MLRKVYREEKPLTSQTASQNRSTSSRCHHKRFIRLVGAGRFERPTPCCQGQCSQFRSCWLPHELNSLQKLATALENHEYSGAGSDLPGETSRTKINSGRLILT